MFNPIHGTTSLTTLTDVMFNATHVTTTLPTLTDEMFNPTPQLNGMPTTNNMAPPTITVANSTGREHYRAPDTTTILAAQHVTPNHMTYPIGNTTVGTVATERTEITTPILKQQGETQTVVTRTAPPVVNTQPSLAVTAANQLLQAYTESYTRGNAWRERGSTQASPNNTIVVASPQRRRDTRLVKPSSS